MVEDHFSRFRSTHAEFILFLSSGKTFCSSFNNECGRIILCARFSCTAHHHSHIAGDAMCDPVLCSVDDPVIAITRGCALHIPCIATGVRLSESPGTNEFGSSQLWQIFSFLFFV